MLLMSAALRRSRNVMVRSQQTWLRGYHCMVESTPNPRARKITPVSSKGVILDVVSPETQELFHFVGFHRDTLPPVQTTNDTIPLVHSLFDGTQSVNEVFLSRQFLSVTLTDEDDWDSDPSVMGMLDTVDAFFEKGPGDDAAVKVWLEFGQIMAGRATEHLTDEEVELVKDIMEVLETKVR